jgi:sialate O-acetylesterase
MKKHLIFFILFAWMCSSVSAKVVLPEIFSDNMVLQQSTKVKIWGKAKPNAVVTLKSSWNAKSVTTRCDKDGSWSTFISTPKASYTPQTLKISDGEAVTLSNILIGEVWLCSGQSNMDITIYGYWNCPIVNADEVIANASQYKGIRCVTIEQKGALTPQESCHGSWKVSNPKNTLGFSATAFYFAKALNKTLDVPVGVIACSWGGSKVEGWLPENILKTYPDVDLKNASNKDYIECLRPMIMYNGMLHPIEGYTIRGFVWYQGESNIGKNTKYDEKLTTMIQLWRKEWGLGELPFYIVEIAPFNYGDNGDAAAYLREYQYKVATTVPNCGLVCTNDLVEPYEQCNIHPKNKLDIGKRLSYLALSNVYKMEGIECTSPSYKSMEIKGDKAILTINNVPAGYNRMQDMEGFEMAGADKVFHPATGKIFENFKIEVSSPEVSAPVAVRYCFRNFKLGNVKSTRGLPLVPFRTDNW